MLCVIKFNGLGFRYASGFLLIRGFFVIELNELNELVLVLDYVISELDDQCVFCQNASLCHSEGSAATKNLKV